MKAGIMRRNLQLDQTLESFEAHTGGGHEFCDITMLHSVPENFTHN